MGCVKWWFGVLVLWISNTNVIDGVRWWWFDMLVVWIFQHKRKSMGCVKWWLDVLVLWISNTNVIDGGRWWWFDVLVVWIFQHKRMLEKCVGGGLMCYWLNFPSRTRSCIWVEASVSYRCRCHLYPIMYISKGTKGIPYCTCNRCPLIMFRPTWSVHFDWSPVFAGSFALPGLHCQVCGRQNQATSRTMGERLKTIRGHLTQTTGGLQARAQPVSFLLQYPTLYKQDTVLHNIIQCLCQIVQCRAVLENRRHFRFGSIGREFESKLYLSARCSRAGSSHHLCRKKADL